MEHIHHERPTIRRRGPAGSTFHQTPDGTGYHAHGFASAGGGTVTVAAGETIGVWCRPSAASAPNVVLLGVLAADRVHQAVWGYPSTDSDWAPAGAAHVQVDRLSPLGQWRLLSVDAAALGLAGTELTGLEFGCVDGAVDWGPAGTYPPAPPTTTSGATADRQAAPQLVRDTAYDVIASDVYPWSTAPLDLGYCTATAALAALGVDAAELVGAFTTPDRAAELREVTVATAQLGIGPRLHDVLTGADGHAERDHWGPFDDADGDWFNNY